MIIYLVGVCVAVAGSLYVVRREGEDITLAILLLGIVMSVYSWITVFVYVVFYLSAKADEIIIFKTKEKK